MKVFFFCFLNEGRGYFIQDEIYCVTIKGKEEIGMLVLIGFVIVLVTILSLDTQMRKIVKQNERIIEFLRK
ncbi:hypothetical protein CJ485_04635 [Priestia filamentosa]|nr:hypothetical protein CJ485_04635 [Priestia filamentosa]